MNAGADSTGLTTNTLHDRDTVICLLTNSTRDTVKATSNEIVVTGQTMSNAGVITGPENVCVGTTITLSDTALFGAWSPGDQYASDSAGIIKGLATQGFECSEPTPDTVLYIVKNSCGADTAAFPFTIQPQPSVAIELRKTTACIFERIEYIVWHSPCCSANFTQTESGKGYLTGYIIGYDSTYCGSYRYKYPDKLTYILPVEDTPVFSVSESAICIDSAVKITYDATGFAQYWTVGNDKGVLFSDTTGIYLVAKDSGTILLTLRYGNICGASPVKKSIPILVKNSPKHLAPVASICKDQSITMSQQYPGATWSVDRPDIVLVDSTGKIKGKNEGVAVITYAFPTGCYVTAEIPVENCGGVVTVFPNPAHDDVVIRLLVNDWYTGCAVMNTQGATLFTKSLNFQYTIINVSHLSRGLYFLRLSGPGGNDVYRFVKE